MRPVTTAAGLRVVESRSSAVAASPPLAGAHGPDLAATCLAAPVSMAVVAAIPAARCRAALPGRRAFPHSRLQLAAAPKNSEAAAATNEQKELEIFLNTVNEGYEQVHRCFEEQFWGTKMALAGKQFSLEALASSKGAMEEFLSDPQSLKETRRWLQSGVPNAEQQKVLRMLERTFECYIMESEDAKKLREETTKIEGSLGAARNKMRLGAELPGEGFVELSSVGLRMRMRTDSDEAVRKACFQGMQSIGPFVCQNGFVEIVKTRNQMAKALGYVDFYDYKVTQAEGFGKERLFEILDTLEQGTRDQLERAKRHLVQDKGEEALEPWNTGYMLAGDVTKKLDPFFPFEKALDRWAQSYAAMGIGYRGATMTLDLLDRKGKYSNGFCHWPQPPWLKPDGSWQPSAANFTSLADPRQVGSGHTALSTLMHEAGHAAHMANVVQPSPLFAQERAPMSIAYAETQSMFLDSLVSDAAWCGRYARDRENNVVPWALLEEDLRSRHPYAVFALRRMISVPYFEKALYELPEAEVTARRITQLAAEVEGRIGGGPSPLPLMAVPHILADESSCYYHGYVLAEMAVHQTRAFFLRRDGCIVDNPAVGPTLAEAYWRPGNSAVFLELVQNLTGRPLTGDAWVSELKRPMDEVLSSEKADYEAAVEAGTAAKDSLDLGMRMRIVDGDKVIADSDKEESFSAASSRFEAYIKQLISV